MVFGKRETKSEMPAREDVITSLYAEPARNEVPLTPMPTASDYSRDTNLEGVIDAHARFNGKFVSDRDMRIDGEAQGEIECSGTLVISPQAKVRATVKAQNIIVSGDYEGNVEATGRFEIGTTGRVKGQLKTQVLIIKEGAFFEGSVIMSRQPAAAERGDGSNNDSAAKASLAAESDASSTAESFSKEPVGAAAAATERQATGPGGK
jgi:cytoskeletal protein CcmA (bactofilin family)